VEVVEFKSRGKPGRSSEPLAPPDGDTFMSSKAGQVHSKRQRVRETSDSEADDDRRFPHMAIAKLLQEKPDVTGKSKRKNDTDELKRLGAKIKNQKAPLPIVLKSRATQKKREQKLAEESRAAGNIVQTKNSKQKKAQKQRQKGSKGGRDTFKDLSGGRFSGGVLHVSSSVRRKVEQSGRRQKRR